MISSISRVYSPLISSKRRFNFCLCWLSWRLMSVCFLPSCLFPTIFPLPLLREAGKLAARLRFGRKLLLLRLLSLSGRYFFLFSLLFPHCFSFLIFHSLFFLLFLIFCLSNTLFTPTISFSFFPLIPKVQLIFFPPPIQRGKSSFLWFLRHSDNFVLLSLQT